MAYKVTLKLEDKTDNMINKEVEVTTSAFGTNEWEELTFDFAASESGKYDKIVLFFAINSTTNGDTYYFDDFRLHAGPPTAPITSAPTLSERCSRCDLDL